MKFTRKQMAEFAKFAARHGWTWANKAEYNSALACYFDV